MTRLYGLADSLYQVELVCCSRIGVIRRLALLDEPPFREHGISRCLYLGDRVSIVGSFLSMWRWDTSGSCDLSSKWMACCPVGLQIVVRHTRCRNIPSPGLTSSTELRREPCWKSVLRSSYHEYISAYTASVCSIGIAVSSRKCREM